jgi:hypothetical protein
MPKLGAMFTSASLAGERLNVGDELARTVG